MPIADEYIVCLLIHSLIRSNMSEPARIWFTAAFRLSAFPRVSYKCNASAALAQMLQAAIQVAAQDLMQNMNQPAQASSARSSSAPSAGASSATAQPTPDDHELSAHLTATWGPATSMPARVRSSTALRQTATSATPQAAAPARPASASAREPVNAAAASSSSIDHPLVKKEFGPFATTKAKVAEQRQAKEDAVIFLPQRLLFQNVDLKSQEMMTLLSKRGCRVKVSIPPDAKATDVQKIVKEAFMDQATPVDLNASGMQFAYFPDHKKTKWLAPHPKSLDQCDGKTVFHYYGGKNGSQWVIVPAESKFREEETSKSKSARAKSISVISVHDSDSDEFADGSDEEIELPSLNLLRAKTTHPKTASRAKSVGLGPGLPNPSGLPRPRPPRLHTRCVRCLAPLEMREDDPFEVRNKVEEEHSKHCPRDEFDSLPFCEDSEDPDGPLKPNCYDFPTDLTGIHPSMLPFILRKLEPGKLLASTKAYFQVMEEMEKEEQSREPDAAQDDQPLDPETSNTYSCAANCGKADDGEMVQCETCSVPGWIHYSCAGISGEPSEDWQCNACLEDPDKSTQPSATSSKAKCKRKRVDPPGIAGSTTSSTKKATTASTIIIPKRASTSAASTSSQLGESSRRLRSAGSVTSESQP
ncbi:hypothetical protein V8E36_009609 [Tilletia maclaganii]